MATDATGTPTTNCNIPKFNTSVDAPSGLGFNAAMDAIDALIASRVNKPTVVTIGDVPVWNGSTFVRPTGTADLRKLLAGDGSWAQMLRGQVQSTGTPTFGTGFTITKGATGVYTINFTNAFGATPAVVVTAIGAAGYADITANSTSAVTFTMVNTAGVAADIGFNFIAIGNV